MRNTFYTILISTLLFAINTAGQNSYDLRQFGNETAGLFKRPLKWNVTDFSKLGLIGSITFGLMHIDDDVKYFARQDTSLVGSLPLEIGRYWGEPVITLGLGLGFIIHGINSGNDANKKLGFEIAQSFIYSVAITSSLKFILGRARPYTGQSAFSFRPLNSFSDDFWSLPSGHTTVAFSLSTVLSQNIKSNFLKILVYIPAIITGYSRISYNKHWLSDVFLGGVVGYTIGRYLTKIHENNEQKIIEANRIPLINFNYAF